jgi:hypothetical protein
MFCEPGSLGAMRLASSLGLGGKDPRPLMPPEGLTGGDNGRQRGLFW